MQPSARCLSRCLVATISRSQGTSGVPQFVGVQIKVSVFSHCRSQRSVQADCPRQAPLLSYQYQLLTVQSGPTHNFSVITQFLTSSCSPFRVCQACNSSSKSVRGLELVFHCSPFFPGPSASHVEGRRDTRKDSRGHMKNGCCLW